MTVTSNSRRLQDPITRNGNVRGEKCKAIVDNWRTKGVADSFCKMNREKDSDYCVRHQFLARTSTRGAQAVVAKYQQIGEQRRVSPVVALAELVAESAGNVEYLRHEVTKLEKLVIAGRKEREEVAKIMVLYNEERDRYERYAMDALRIRLEERREDLRRKDAEKIVTVLKQFVDQQKLMGEERKNALAFIAALLMKVTDDDDKYEGPFIEAKTNPNVIDAEFRAS